MKSLIIFDLDGVLIDSKEIHFNSLNLALSSIDDRYVISRAEQDSTYEGLPTIAKLQILTQTKGLSKELYDTIWKRKQQYSSTMFLSINVDNELINLFKLIRQSNIGIAVASNSIRSTLDNCIKALGLSNLIDYSLSNEDVDSPKPSSDIYIKCMKHFDISPNLVAIFEDSPVGKQAARGSGAKVFEVENRLDLTFDKISDSIKYLNGENYE
jgi:HAD superfamily hydrolase (TIGR01509 family)